MNATTRRLSGGLQAGLAVLGLCALLSGWGFLYGNSHAVDSAEQTALLDRLRDIKQMDAEWSANVLRSHADVNANYDALTAPLQPLAEALARLGRAPAVAQEEALKAKLEQLRTTVADKSQMVDRFKSQNSLYKNSLRYIPTAEKDIQRQLAQQRDAGVATGSSAAQAASKAMSALEKSMGSDAAGSEAEARERMARAMAQLRSTVAAAQAADGVAKATAGIAGMQSDLGSALAMSLHYASVPDTDTAQQLQQQIEHIRENLPHYPAAVQESVQNLLAHLGTVLRLRDQQTQLLRDVSRLPVGMQADALGAGLSERFGQELQVQFQYQRWLLGYSAVALALIVLATAFILYRGATERRRLNELVRRQTLALQENEVHLVQAQKMSAIGELAAGLAHEVNTPLAAVKSSLQSTRELMVDVAQYVSVSGEFVQGAAAPRPSSEAEQAAHRMGLQQRLKAAMGAREQLASFDTLKCVEELVATSLQSVDHISRVVVNMLNFSRLDRTKVTRGKLEDGIESTLMIGNHLLKHVKVVKEYGSTPEIECDMAQINQVVLNLVKNAVDAMPETGGELKLRTRTAGDRVVLEIADNGSGIPQDVLPKIWDPFFTTKPKGVGTGLGLSTCRKIVKAHGGTVSVASTPGLGTTFSIALPLKAAASLQEDTGRRADEVQLAEA